MDEIGKLLTQAMEVEGPGGSKIVIKGPLDAGINDLGGLISKIFYVVFMPFVGVILLGVIIWGGYDYLLSQGDSSKIEAGKKKITTGIIGVILIVLSYFLAPFVAKIFGLPGFN